MGLAVSSLSILHRVGSGMGAPMGGLGAQRCHFGEVHEHDHEDGAAALT
jgi:hypothetical protein